LKNKKKAKHREKGRMIKEKDKERKKAPPLTKGKRRSESSWLSVIGPRPGGVSKGLRRGPWALGKGTFLHK